MFISIDDQNKQFILEIAYKLLDLNFKIVATKGTSKFLNDNPKEYLRFLKTQKLIRNIDEIHIIDDNKNLLYSNLDDVNKYNPPLDQALKLVLDDDGPLKIINAEENISGYLRA